jgi:hypothetical protein
MDEGRAARRAAGSRTVKPCGPVPPTLGSSEWRCPFATEANKPGTPGRARSSRKPIAQGVRVVPASPDYLVGIFLSAHETSGCGQRPVLPAPSVLRGPTNCKARTRKSRRGNAASCLLCCRAPRRRGTQYPRGISVKHGRLWNTGSSGRAGRRHRVLETGHPIPALVGRTSSTSQVESTRSTQNARSA